MRYVVFGAGAIGGGVGGLLQLAGLEVTLVARGEHLRAMRDDGLSLQVGHDHHRLDVTATDDVTSLQWTDDTVVLLATKSQATQAALDALLPTMPVTTPVVALQNGVANEGVLLRHLPHVHGVCVMMPASHLRPGEVVVHSAGVPALLDIGRYPDAADDVSRAVAADLVAAGCASEVRDDIMSWKYRKLLMNLGNGVDAAFVDDEAAGELTRRARVEGEDVLTATGIHPVNAAEDRERRGDLLRPLVDRDDAGSSTWQSVARGAGDTEVDHLNGEIVLIARENLTEAPVNEAIRQAVLGLVRDGGAPRSLDAGELLARLDV